MRHFLTAIAAVLAGAMLTGSLATPAFAAKSGSQRYYQSQYGKITIARHVSGVQRCKGGRYYTYGGGWGCDYYRYSYDYPLGRR
jgi:hypothetical protein